MKDLSGLTKVFLRYLNYWKENIEKREGNYEKSAFHGRTHIGLKIRILSPMGVTKYLLSNGAEYLLTNKLCQDHVREYFAGQRAI